MTKTSKKVNEEKVVKDINNYDYDKLMNEYTTKSGVIRYLTKQNFTRSQISKFMGVIYQHVRNVQVQDIERQEKIEREKNKK